MFSVRFLINFNLIDSKFLILVYGIEVDCAQRLRSFSYGGSFL